MAAAAREGIAAPSRGLNHARMNILSVQSAVAYGHVGNAAAVFPLQRLGAEVWPVNTVQFSNHTGYGDWAGEVFGEAAVAALIAGIDRRGALAQCDGVLSGYLGDAGIGRAILGGLARVRAQRPGALYCCDPVIGDSGRGVYVRPGIAEFLREQALPEADLATPNAFELSLLTGLPCATLAETKTAIARLQTMMRPAGPRAVLLTSLQAEATPEGCIDLLAAEAGAFYLLRTPRLALAPNGAGDVIAALFLFHRLRRGRVAPALEAAASAVHGLLRVTAAAGGGELRLIAAQNEFVRPTQRFRATVC